MKKTKTLCALLSVVISLQMLCPIGRLSKVNTVSAAESHEPYSIAGSLPSGNLLESGDFNSESCLSRWDKSTYGGQFMKYEEDANGGYLSMNRISVCWVGFTYTPTSAIPAGKYKFTGYFRTQNEGEITRLRIIVNYANGTNSQFAIYCGNDWLKAEFYIDTASDITSFKVAGGPFDQFRQDYCIDHFSLVAVDTIPEDASGAAGDDLGISPAEYANKAYESSRQSVTAWDPTVESQYEVNGIMINHDCTAYISNIGANSLNVQDFIDLARSFEGSHVTDYIINVDQVMPSEIKTSYLEMYHQTEQGGNAADFKSNTVAIGAHRVYDILGSDYIGVWIDTFNEIGINPWLSFRMNDNHNLVDSGPQMSKTEFWYKNPQVRRVQHHPYVQYRDYAMDYTHDIVREYVLSYINEALNRYDCYGIELDYMRDPYLWHLGGEYNGLDILNEFMRQVDDLVAIYEEKYGHEIKIAVRVAPDIQDCYDFGLDVLTWSAEGIVDTVIAASYYESSYTDIPTKLWKSLLGSDVEFAVNIETNNHRTWPGATSGGHTLETIAGIAASAFSQGADKVYMFNFFLNTAIKESEKITTPSANSLLTGNESFWNIITTIGSYDKLMTINRRLMISYKDMVMYWRSFTSGVGTVQFLPQTVSSSNNAVLNIPLGDVPAGATVKLKFSTSNRSIGSTPPTVYVNSKVCTYAGMESCDGTYTSSPVLCYVIPKSAIGQTYAVVEIKSGQTFTIDFAEIYIDVN
ncbi:MAG: hypothetical protein IJY93_08120 [Clostridia bacterium]|nr:hypothetical protein [Clostridia bacterium]